MFTELRRHAKSINFAARIVREERPCRDNRHRSSADEIRKFKTPGIYRAKGERKAHYAEALLTKIPRRSEFAVHVIVFLCNGREIRATRDTNCKHR